ncbi:MAG: GNAT family N-acetyltransferase [Provencibacterium sp.]|jgi:RimJ/RimL family protein N-acetyltransferase|nr:GNAT family N-acetyltransferase [Provencibacterium sp.]
MKIRKADDSDFPAILPVYAHARQQMQQTGNPNQWGKNKPSPETLREDIREGNLYLLEEDEKIVGVFAFIIGEDPTYRYIEGSWKNNRPYGTVHRLASSGQAHGIWEGCFHFCRSLLPNLRIDTHADNRIMQRLVEKSGFERCGIIYLEDKSPRIAYQYAPEQDMPAE